MNAAIVGEDQVTREIIKKGIYILNYTNMENLP